MAKRFSALLGSLAFAPLLLAAPAAGGETGASIYGKITDPDGSPVVAPELRINLRNLDTGNEITGAIAGGKTFEFKGLKPGKYQLVVPIPCCMYESYESRIVEVKAGEKLQLDANVQWGLNLGTIGDDPSALGEEMRAQTVGINDPTPRHLDGKPDFSGVWFIFPHLSEKQPKMKPWAAKMHQELKAINKQGPAFFCLPQRATPTTLKFPYKFVHTPKLMIQLTEFVTPAHRQIFIDGRKPTPKDELVPSWYGESIASWEGDTLVIVTQGFNEITPGYGVHTDKLKVTERISRPVKGRIVIDITAEDPDAWEEPYQVRYEAGLAEKAEIMEYVCNENNRAAMRHDGEMWRGRP